MLDHVFLDVIGALRRAFESGFLHRLTIEERFRADVLLGDLSWETSYSLPGEGTPPRVRVDVNLDWPTWSQSAYRSLVMGEEGDERPEIGIELVLRIQRLASAPELRRILDVLPEHSPAIGTEELNRTGPTVAQSYGDGLDHSQVAVEISYEGTYCVDAALGDASLLDNHFGTLGTWVASTLVRLGDLRLDFLPADAD